MTNPQNSSQAMSRARRLAALIGASSLLVLSFGIVAGPANADSGAYTNGTVRAIAYDNAGGFYIGGDFTTVKGSSRPYLAHINSDATLDTNFAPVLSSGASVKAIEVSGSGSGATVYFGGTFSTVNTTTRNNAAAVDASGTLTSWNPNTNGFVSTLRIDGSDIYLGGMFTSVQGTTRNRAAMVNTSNTLSTTFNPNVDGVVNDIVLSGSNVYLCGLFTSVRGTQREDVAAVNKSNTLQSWGTRVSGSTTYYGTNGDCRAMAVGTDADGTTAAIFIGGDFTTMLGLTRKETAEITAAGTIKTWTAGVGITSGNPYVQAIAVNGSKVFVGGLFDTVTDVNNGTTVRSNLAGFDTSRNALDLNVGAAGSYLNPDPNGAVLALSAVPGVGLAAGGLFTVSALVDQNYYSGPQLGNVKLQVGGTDASPDVPISKGDQVKAVGYGFYDAGGNETSNYQWQRCSSTSTSSCQDITGKSTKAGTQTSTTGAWYGTTNNDIGFRNRIRVYWDTVNGLIQQYSGLAGISDLVVAQNPRLSSSYNSFGKDADANAYTAPQLGVQVKPFIGTGNPSANPLTAVSKWQGYVAGKSAFTTQWERCSNVEDAATCVEIPAANGGTLYWYTPKAADLDSGLRVKFTLTTTQTYQGVDAVRSKVAYSPITAVVADPNAIVE